MATLRCRSASVIAALATLASAPFEVVAMGSGLLPQVADSQMQTAEDRARAVLPDLRDSTTLAMWKRVHPGDTIFLYGTNNRVYGYDANDWCALAVTELPQPGNAAPIRRRAYFYAPQMPSSGNLPVAASGESIADQCRLGVVRIGFTRAEVLSANDWGAVPPSTLAAYHGRLHDDRTKLMLAARRARLDEAFSTAAIIGSGENVLRELLASSELSTPALSAGEVLRHALASENQKRTDKFDSAAVLNALVQWVSYAATLSPARRAAALIVADEALDIAWNSGPFGSSHLRVLRQQLGPLGAIFSTTSIEFPYVTYTRSWLRDAATLSNAGRAGEIAFINSLSMALDAPAPCFRDVIARGERFLRGNPNSALAAEVRFMVAEAYADIVTLAAGGPRYANTDNASYQWEPGLAQARALEEFRVAIALAGPGSERSRIAWQIAFRLAAGIPPVRTFFSCS